jgi:hypothetical protein
VRYIAPAPRMYSREMISPVRIVTSTSTLPTPSRVRPSSSVLSQELDRLERKFQSIPLRDNYTTLDDDFLRPSAYLAVRATLNVFLPTIFTEFCRRKQQDDLHLYQDFQKSHRRFRRTAGETQLHIIRMASTAIQMCKYLDSTLT